MMARFLMVLSSVAMGLAATPQGQHAPPRAFEVAIIRPQPMRPHGLLQQPPNRFYRAYITLANLVNYAWDMRPYRILGGPDWMRTLTWEIMAKADDEPTAAEMRLMVRRLLEERFKLRWHVETRRLPIY